MKIFVKNENFYHYPGAHGGGKGEYSPPQQKKIVVEKWSYFPEVYKMTKVQEDGIEKG